MYKINTYEQQLKYQIQALIGLALSVIVLFVLSAYYFEKVDRYGTVGDFSYFRFGLKFSWFESILFLTKRLVDLQILSYIAYTSIFFLGSNTLL